MEPLKSPMLADYRNGEHQLFMKTAVEYLQKMEEPFEKLKTAIEQLAQTAQQEDVALKQEVNTDSADKLRKLDKEQDRYFISLYGLLRFLADEAHPSSVHETARDLVKSIRKYSIDTQSAVKQQVGLTMNMLQDLKLKEESLNKLGQPTQEWYEGLKKVNAEMVTLVAASGIENASYVNGLIKTARTASDEAWRSTAKLLSACTLMLEEEKYTKAVAELNGIIADFNATVVRRAAQRAAAAKPGEQKPTEVKPETKPDGNQPAEPKPENKPAEGKPSEDKPTDVKPEGTTKPESQDGHPDNKPTEVRPE